MRTQAHPTPPSSLQSWCCVSSAVWISVNLPAFSFVAVLSPFRYISSHCCHLYFILYSYFVSHCIHFELNLVLILSIFAVSLCLFQSLSSYLDHLVISLCLSIVRWSLFALILSLFIVSVYSFWEFFVDFRGLEVVFKFLALICCLRKHI